MAASQGGPDELMASEPGRASWCCGGVFRLLPVTVLMIACSRPAAGETEGAGADQLQRQLESHLEAWTLRGEEAELHFVRAMQLPKYRKNGEGEPLLQLSLKVGESFSLVDRHFSMRFVLRSASEQALEFDYEHLTSHPGRPRTRDTGRFSLSRELTQTGFQDVWRSCSTSAQCTVLSTSCAGFVGASKGSEWDLPSRVRGVGADTPDCARLHSAPRCGSC